MSVILKQKIQEKVVWKGQDLINKSDWIYHLSKRALVVFDEALQSLQAKGLGATEFSLEDYQITDAEVLAEIALWSEELENGYGFLLLRGLDAQKYSEAQMATIYYLMGLHMGLPVTQNPKGELLVAVQNVGDKQNKSTRVYQTNAYLPYHTDLSDVVGLLSIHKAKEGGLSSLVSAAAIYNEVLEKHPEFLSYYYLPTYCDHLGDKDPVLTPIFSFFKGKLSCRYLRAYIELGHERKGIAISQVEKEAMDIMDSLIHDPSMRLDMMMEPGDIQFCNNYTVMHSRSAFEDDEDPSKRRKLLRLWLKMPNARELSPDFPGRNGIPKDL